MTADQATGTTDDDRPRRRQARGERRIEQLLDAAASVFSACGYTASSTNAIARQAGVSPGTLYQFFPNKEAIAVELGSRLTRQMREHSSQALTPENASLSLAELLDAVLDPVIEFNCGNPALLAVLSADDAPGRVAEEHEALHADLLGRTEALLLAYRPDLPAERATHAAAMSLAMFKGGLGLIMGHEGTERAAYTAELKSALYGYLAPLLGTDAPRARP